MKTDEPTMRGTKTVRKSLSKTNRQMFILEICTHTKKNQDLRNDLNFLGGLIEVSKRSGKFSILFFFLVDTSINQKYISFIFLII